VNHDWSKIAKLTRDCELIFDEDDRECLREMSRKVRDKDWTDCAKARTRRVAEALAPFDATH
jgi:hypothetical protein